MLVIVLDQMPDILYAVFPAPIADLHGKISFHTTRHKIRIPIPYLAVRSSSNSCSQSSGSISDNPLPTAVPDPSADFCSTADLHFRKSSDPFDTDVRFRSPVHPRKIPRSSFNHLHNVHNAVHIRSRSMYGTLLDPAYSYNSCVARGFWFGTGQE